MVNSHASVSYPNHHINVYSMLNLLLSVLSRFCTHFMLHKFQSRKSTWLSLKFCIEWHPASTKSIDIQLVYKKATIWGSYTANSNGCTDQPSTTKFLVYFGFGWETLTSIPQTCCNIYIQPYIHPSWWQKQRKN